MLQAKAIPDVQLTVLFIIIIIISGFGIYDDDEY